METRWLYTTSENFSKLREEACETCIIPMGCIEKHGLHLPLGTDIIEAEQLAWMTSQLESVCVFPGFTFGDIPDDAPNMPEGTITIPMDMEMLLLEQLCRQIARNGFKKIVILNSHGGNRPWIKAFLRKLENKPHDFVLMSIYVKCGMVGRMGKVLTEKGSGAIPELTEEDEKYILECYAREDFEDGHGAFSETAYIMGIAPESVRLERLGIESGKSRNLASKYAKAGIEIKDGGWAIDYPNAFEGDDPIGCNERIGKAALRIEAERIAKAIRLIKEDQDLLKWHHELWTKK